MIAVAIVILGGVVISCGEEIDNVKIKGNLLALLGAVMASLYIITGRKVRQDYSLTEYTTVLYFFTSVILFITALALQTELFCYSLKDYLLVLFLAMVPQLLGHNAFNWALKYLSPTFVAILILFEPIGATVISYFLFGYIPSYSETIGSLLILVGILISIK
ncbi:MAG: DMT family transporter [Deltaproteobacteria bacterium]|nr:DMT family transporter [Deltaproteobacteria bacterium]